MALFDWLFGRTPKSTQQNQSERAREEFRPAPIARALARPAFAHTLRVPEGSFRFVALDVETSCSDAASICQIGLACVQPDNQIQTFSMLVNPATRFDAFNIQFHGIGPDHVADAPRFPDALNALLPLLTRHRLIQHSNFDKQAMNAACGFCGIDAPDLRWSDSVQIARRAWPELKGNGGHGLANLKRTLNLQFHHHDAGEDGLPGRKTLALCQNDAVQLHGLIYALDHLLLEGGPDNRDLSSAAHSLCMIARDLSGRLANDLDGVAA